MKAGNYSELCMNTPMLLCPLLNPPYGLPTKCYSRNIHMGPSYIFEFANMAVYFLGLIMVSIMLFSITNRSHAHGKREFLTFFYMYLGYLFIESFAVTGVFPLSSSFHSFISAIDFGLSVSLSFCLFLNGLVPFQLLKDGEYLSVMIVRYSTLGVFLMSTLVGLGTFKEFMSLNPNNPVAIWVVQIIFINIFITGYFISQVVYVIRMLEDKWPLGDVTIAYLFYIAGLLMMFQFNNWICSAAKHYLDGTFACTICTLLAVMMVYKYFNSITKADMDFTLLTISILDEQEAPKDSDSSEKIVKEEK